MLVWMWGKNKFGAIAQSGERLHGMQEVVVSITTGSTTFGIGLQDE